MREAVRINSGFGEGGDGGINNGCIQEVGEGKGVDGSSVGLGLTVLVLFFCPYPSQIPVAVAVAAAAGIWNPFPCAFCIIYDGANGFGFVAYSDTDWDGDLETC